MANLEALDRLLAQVKLQNSSDGKHSVFKREMSKVDASGCTTAFNEIVKHDWAMPVVAQSASLSRKSSTESLDSQQRHAKKIDFPVYELHFGSSPRVFSPSNKIVNVAQLAMAATPHTKKVLPEHTPLKVVCNSENRVSQDESPSKNEKNRRVRHMRHLLYRLV